jgi:uncharacterized damage-inducible protein DinB
VRTFGYTNTMADRAYVAENEVERKRLASLVARLSDQDLARPMPGGWTVASVLGHVAFWDQRIIALIEAWHRLTRENTLSIH